jgi:hypothetical protein
MESVRTPDIHMKTGAFFFSAASVYNRYLSAVLL